MNTPPLNDLLSSFRLRPNQERTQGQAKPEWNSYLLRLVEKGESPGNWTLPLLLQTITEKSILVMIDPRPSLVPGEPGLLSNQS